MVVELVMVMEWWWNGGDGDGVVIDVWYWGVLSVVVEE